MQKVIFDPKGGAISAEVRSGYANPGSYLLRLWAKDSNAKAMDDAIGNFLNADVDTYVLPGPALNNDGRIVESFVTIAPAAGEKRFFASLRIIQDKRLLAEVSVPGETDRPSVTIDLFVKLVAEKTP